MLLLFLACVGGATPGTTIETTALTDVGTLYWNSTGDLQVDFQQCLSSSCDTLLAVECTTSLEDDVLLVTATCEITDDWLAGAQIRARYGTVDTPLG